MVYRLPGNAGRVIILSLTIHRSIAAWNRLVLMQGKLTYLPKASQTAAIPGRVGARVYSSDAMETDPTPFSVKPDIYECIVLDLRQEKHSCNDDEFQKKLNGSLNKWKADGIRGVTVYIPSNLAARIPSVLQLGFDFHHANPGYVLLLKWLSETEVNNFPAYANQFLGVGGFVVNDNEEVLVIKERFTGPNPRWKFPGGGTDPGEDIAVTARREVLEETGVESEFVGVLCYRHFHAFRYGCSDTYQACLLRATSSEIRKCDQEILEARWMKVDELGRQDLFGTTRYIYEAYLNYLKTGVLIEGQTVPGFRDGTQMAVYRASNTHPVDSN
ncbi:uncharacterized protein [Watersipora subatra]|uniref:uncharacterized protein n=1 Tax=Watersipora subatra TaxID=2589382 RepID=UPI00355C5E09